MVNNKKRLSILQIINKFPNDEVAEKWFMNTRWSDGISCPCCSSCEVTQRKTIKRSWRCKECRKDFSTKTNTLM